MTDPDKPARPRKCLTSAAKALKSQRARRAELFAQKPQSAQEAALRDLELAAIKRLIGRKN